MKDAIERRNSVVNIVNERRKRVMEWV